MQHHAYVVAGDSEAGVKAVKAHIERELGMKAAANPDVIVLRYGLLAVDDARRIISLAQQAAIGGEHKAIVIRASRIYHEAQNAFLKLFEEPPRGTTLYLIVPELGQLLPTLRSRVATLESKQERGSSVSDLAVEFVRGSREKRSAIIKKLTSGTDEEERRAARDEALALVSGVEALAYEKNSGRDNVGLLRDISILRAYLYDRSAPVKMILEHVSLVLPKNFK